MEFRVLGRIEVYSDDTPVHVGGAKQRSILALLIANRGQAVSSDRIVDEIYGDNAASGARRSVQTIVSMLRRDLSDVIVGTGDGYLFDGPRETVDVCRFEDGVAAGLALVGSDPRQASSIFDEALGLWRGDPYGDVDGRGAFEPEIARLTELRFTALEARVEADLACGRHREVVAELEALVGEFPLRERLWGWLMLALYRTGRQADALAAFQRARAAFGELGLEPSVELRELEEQVLLRDESLDLVPMVPHNLPASLTSFVGRRLELIELGERLAETRLVTLTGTGGSGKTRLAIEHGRDVLDDYPDGVWFVDLRGVDAKGVPLLIASTLGVSTVGDTPIADQLVDALVDRRLLLMLDNCEHVLNSVAPLAQRLTTRDGQIRVLATSRERLGVPGESAMPVRPLPVPEVAGFEQLAASDAAVLFVDRAGFAQPGFGIDEHIGSVFEICRTVEGLPLALELAAARLVVFSPEELAVRLDDQLAMLRSSQRAGDLRHATIETTIAWSWDLLDDAEQALLSRLTVFHRTWSLNAAEAICGFEPISQDQVVDLVGSLVTKSLAVVDGVSAGSTRYRLLEPIRQYAAHKLDNDDAEHLHGRFIDYWCAALTELHDPDSQVAWRDHEQATALEPDQANLTAAVEWALASERFNDAVTIFASSFGDLLALQGSALELTSRWMESALKHRDAIAPGPLVWAIKVMVNIVEGLAARDAMYLRYATLGIEVSRSSEERHWFELDAALATNNLEGHTAATDATFDRVIDQTNDPFMRASALLAKSKFGTTQETWALVEQAMELSPIESLVWWDEAIACMRISESAGVCGHFDVAEQMAERALELTRRSGQPSDQTLAAGMLGWLYAARGRLDEAAALYAEAVPVTRRILGPSLSRSLIPRWTASIARQQGRFDQARRFAEEGRRVAEQTGSGERGKVSTLFAIRELALIARDEGDFEQARDILDDALQCLEDLEHANLGPWARSEFRTTRASVELRRDEPDRALEDLTAVLAEPDVPSHIGKVLAVELTAIALAQQGKAEQAARLLGAVDRERERTGLVIRPPDVPLRESALHDIQSILGPDWASSEAQGRTMTLNEAFDYAATESSVDEDALGTTPDAARSADSPG